MWVSGLNNVIWHGDKGGYNMWDAFLCECKEITLNITMWWWCSNNHSPRENVTLGHTGFSLKFVDEKSRHISSWQLLTVHSIYKLWYICSEAHWGRKYRMSGPLECYERQKVNEGCYENISSTLVLEWDLFSWENPARTGGKFILFECWDALSTYKKYMMQKISSWRGSGDGALFYGAVLL